MMDTSAKEFKDQEIHNIFGDFLMLFFPSFGGLVYPILFAHQIYFDLMTLFESKVKIVGGPGWVYSIFCDLCLQLGQ